jgi:dolichol-phosphate mannosyltransferase
VENIGLLLETIAREAPAFNVLVVDDNSPDGTAGVVKSKQLADSRVHLLSRPKKDGLAAAYGAGFQWGIDNGYDMLVEMDADFSHEPRMLPIYLAAIADADVVVGSRYVPGGRIVGLKLVSDSLLVAVETYTRARYWGCLI